MAVPSTAPHPLAPPPQDTEPPQAGGGGDVLLVVFFVATVTMVAAIVVVGSVTDLWVLVPIMVLDLLVTFVVIATISRLLGDDGDPPR